MHWPDLHAVYRQPALGFAAVAGYTAATKADQVSVLVNNAMMTAISNLRRLKTMEPVKRTIILAGVRVCSRLGRL
ncbi:MAG: hypothetical protein V8Q27_09675 [Eubacteriales bacterium]